MPPHLLQAQNLLQQRIIIIPQDGQKPTYWLFLIALSAIVGFALLSALIGLAAAKCCRKTRTQKDIEKKAARNIQMAKRVRNASSSTLADNEDELVERRTAELLAIDAFVGREQKLYANHKKAKMNRSQKPSSIVMPVTMAELKRWAVRSVTSCDGDPSKARKEPRPAPEMAAASASEPSRGSGTTLQIPPSSHLNSSTSTDYQEPATLVEDICSIKERESDDKQKTGVGHREK